MADESDQIQGDNLGDLTRLLLGAGAAGAGTYVASKANPNDLKNTYNTLVSPFMFGQLGGARKMHPATAETMGWPGSLGHPDAVATQRDADNFIMKNLSRFRVDNPSSKLVDTAHSFGWQYGPYMGFSREINPEGMSITSDKIIHPGGNLMKVGGINSLDWLPEVFFRKKDSTILGNYNPNDRRIALNQGMLTNPGIWDNLLETYPPDRLRNMNAIAEHELQHGIQYHYDNDLWRKYPASRTPVEKDPAELEAHGAEYRYRHPEAYNIPFHATTDYGNFINNVDNELGFYKR